jgi:hypothetical protein
VNEPQTTSPFSFETLSGTEAVLETAGQAPVPLADETRLRAAVEASGLATYHWTIENDEIIWSSNATEVLGTDPRGYSTGRAFASFLDPRQFHQPL